LPDVRFDEVMAGWVSFTELDHTQALAEGRRARRRMALRLHMEVDDVDALRADPATPIRASGHVELPQLGPPMDVVRGTLQLFVPVPDNRHARMRYRLQCETAAGDPITVSGVKLVEDDPGLDARTDLSTLFVRVFSGWIDSTEDERADAVIATGVLTLSPLAFMRMMGLMRGRRVRFSHIFLRGVLKAYVGDEPGDTRPAFPVDPPRFGGYDPLVWHRVRERNALERRFVPYKTADDQALVLHQLRRPGKDADRGPVVLVHGAAARPNLFYGAPMRTTIADALLERGYDVWVQGWRASIDDPPRRWSLDEAAAFDHPAAIATVVRETGRDDVRVLAHCLGSASYTISVVAGLVPQVKTMVASAIALHPVVPRMARVKTALLLPGMRLTTPWLDAQWGNRAPHAYAKSVALMAHAFRGRDCDDRACQVANFTYGVGPDLLWQHALLEDDVHHFVAREFGYAPVRFFRQIHRSQKAGVLVPFADLAELPKSYTGAPRQDTKITFATGLNNRVFLPAGQKQSFDHFKAFAPGAHEHLEWPRYGHMDPWLGRDAEREVFPSAIAALERG
jgi:hypothetical protein